MNEAAGTCKPFVRFGTPAKVGERMLRSRGWMTDGQRPLQSGVCWVLCPLHDTDRKRGHQASAARLGRSLNSYAGLTPAPTVQTTQATLGESPGIATLLRGGGQGLRGTDLSKFASQGTEIRGNRSHWSALTSPTTEKA